MNAVERTANECISLNGYKTVERSDFPPHWSDEFIQDLARHPGWIRYFPWTGPANGVQDETEIYGVLYNWYVWHDALVTALEVLNRTADDPMDGEAAVNGIRHAMRTMQDEYADILEFVHKTEGKWTEPAPSENLRPVGVES